MPQLLLPTYAEIGGGGSCVRCPHIRPRCQQRWLCHLLSLGAWTTACQASLSITNSWSPPKPMSIELVMPSNHLILCRPLLLPSISPSITTSDQISRSVVSYSLRPHELQHTRPPCPSPTPGVHSDSRPLSQRCHPTISTSVTLFSSCPQSFPISESFPMSPFFTSGGQNIPGPTQGEG